MQRFFLPAVIAMTALSLFVSPASAQSIGSSSTSSATSGTATPSPGVGGRQRGMAGGPERRAREIIAKFDRDGDHALNATELAAFFESLRERAGGRRSQPGAAGTVPSASASATSTPKANGGHGNPQEHAAKAIEKFDKNHDGKLDAGELTAMLIALRERATERKGGTPGQQSQNPPASQSQTHTAPATTIPTNPGS